MPQPLNAPEHAPRAWPLWKPILFLLVVAVGLYYVKWQPYYGKAFVAADSHSIGKSILADGAASPWLAAWQYALVYFTAVWKAALLGVLLGSLVQVLIPRDWLARTLGHRRFPAPCWGADRAAGHDVHLLRRTGCRRHAPPVGIQRRRAGLLARQPGIEPGDAGVYGVCARLAVRRHPPGGGRGDGAGHRLAGAARDRQRPAARRAAAAADDDAERRAAVPRPLGQSAVGAVLVDHPDLRVGGAGAGAARVWLFPHADGAVDNSLLWIIGLAIVGCLFVIPTAAEIPIVQTMMLAGMGAGPALALLMTLPAVSLPSLLMLNKAFSARALCLTAALVALCGALTGVVGMGLV